MFVTIIGSDISSDAFFHPSYPILKFRLLFMGIKNKVLSMLLCFCELNIHKRLLPRSRHARLSKSVNKDLVFDLRCHRDVYRALEKGGWTFPFSPSIQLARSFHTTHSLMNVQNHFRNYTLSCGCFQKISFPYSTRQNFLKY